MSCTPGLCAYAMKHAAVGRCYVLRTRGATLTNGGALAVSLHVLPAIDGDISPGHERGLVRTEVDDEARDLLGLAQSTDGYLRQNFGIEHLLRNRRHHFCPDVSRRDGVDCHPLLRHLQCQRFGEAMHPRLRCGVVGLSKCT